jgi:hypothetical protein
MEGNQERSERRVVGGVDTHKDLHVAAVVDGNYSPPFWEILLDTVTAESPTGEG